MAKSGAEALFDAIVHLHPRQAFARPVAVPGVDALFRRVFPANHSPPAPRESLIISKRDA